MWLRISCLLLVPMVLSLQLSQSPSLPSASRLTPFTAPTVYPCSSTQEASVQAVCRLCGVSTAYGIQALQTAALRGILDDLTELFLLTVMSDLSSHAPAANYTVAGNSQRLCISATDFSEQPDLTDMFQYFGGMQSAQLSVPELFETQGNTEFSYMAVSVVYEDQQLVYDQVDFRFETDAAARVTANVTLALEQIEVTSLNRSYTSRYTGTARLLGTVVPFSIVTPFTRPAGSFFRVNLAVSGLYTLRQWLLLLGSLGGQCLSLSQPAGLSSLLGLRVAFSAMDFRFNPRSDRAELSQIVSFFSSPSFSFGPGMMLYLPSGQYELESDGTCRMALAGTIPTLEVELNVVLTATVSGWYVSGVPLDQNITLGEIETMASSLYPVFSGSLFPIYAAGELDIGALLRPLVLSNPRIRFYYSPNLYINVISVIPWQGSSALLQAMIGSVSSIVESVVTVSQSLASPQFGLDSDITTSNLTTVTSTGDVNLTQYEYMRGEGSGDISEWRIGTYGLATVQRAATCLNPFCSLLAQASSRSSYALSGSMIQGQLSLRGRIPPFPISPGVIMSENDLVMNFQALQPVLFIQGAFVIRGDSRSILRFAGNITDNAGQALISARLETVWTDVFDIPFVYISSLTFRGTVQAGEVDNTEGEGLAFIGTTCYTPWSGFDFNNCLLGRVSVSLNPLDYQQNSLIYRVNVLSPASFLRYILGVEVFNSNNVPVALQGLDLSRSLDLTLTYRPDSSGNRVQIQGFVRYYGVEGWMEASMQQLGVGSIQIAVDLVEFTMAQGNIMVGRDSTGRLRLELPFEIRNSVVQARIYASVSLWSLTSDTAIVIREGGASFRLQGAPFLGLYRTTLQVRSIAWTDLRNSLYEVDGLLGVTDVMRLSWSIRMDLRYWVNQGWDALTTGQNWVNNATALAADSQDEACQAQDCPYTSVCTTLPSPLCSIYATSQSCTQTKSTCQAPTSTCIEYEDQCIIRTNSCLTIQGSECLEWDNTCQETIRVCRDWNTTCDAIVTGSCSVYTLETDRNNCLDMEQLCTLGRDRDQSCVRACSLSEDLANQATDMAQSYTEAFNTANSLLSGFRTLDSLMSSSSSELYTLNSVRIQSVLNSSGIGENDVVVSAEFRTYDLGSLRLVSYTDFIAWNFQEDIINEIRLFRAAKLRLARSRPQGLQFTSIPPFETLLTSFS